MPTRDPSVVASQGVFSFAFRGALSLSFVNFLANIFVAGKMITFLKMITVLIS
jgi:hypothetical protein